jgi:hypothetical protein
MVRLNMAYMVMNQSRQVLCGIVVGQCSDQAEKGLFVIDYGGRLQGLCPRFW